LEGAQLHAGQRDPAHPRRHILDPGDLQLTKNGGPTDRRATRTRHQRFSSNPTIVQSKGAKALGPRLRIRGSTAIVVGTGASGMIDACSAAAASTCAVASAASPSSSAPRRLSKAL